MNTKLLVKALGFYPKENASGIFQKKYDAYVIEVNFDKKSFNFGDKIRAESKSTQNFSQAENWVVLECVDRLLEKGYKPQNITLEKTWKTGHGTSGRLDVLVTHDDGAAYMMIECKTWGKEYEKELSNLHKNGGQLFTYFQQDKNADVILLYTSQFIDGKIQFQNEIINIEKEYKETSNVKDFYDRWNKLTKNNGVFESWVNSYNFESKALTLNDLKDIEEEDSSFIFNQFLEILRHNVVSDKPNAFNKIFTLFLCKIYDEKHTKPNQELVFQWFYAPYTYDGIKYPADTHVSFQKRLTDLYSKGMKAFLEKEVTDISDKDFDKKYAGLDDFTKQEIKDTLTKIRLEKNNEFAIKEVFNSDSFEENAVVVKEIVELLQNYKIRYTKKQQYLSDFFELLLTTGLKQESGQFFTPVPIAQFIIRSLPIDTLVNEKLEKGEKNNLLPKVIDYASGSGHFITESMHVMQQLIDAKNPDDYLSDTSKKIRNWQDDHFDWALKYVYGIEKDYRLVKVGKVGCYLHGDGLAQIVHSDGLGNFKTTKDYKGALNHADADFEKENKQFDIVVSNPPYSVSSFKNNARKFYSENDFELYDYLTDNSSEIECLFIERTKQLLKDGGIAGIILPSSILSNTGIYSKSREMILQYFEIIAIAEFGSNTFMATGTNTVTLFLRRRNNYDVINFKSAIFKLFTSLNDITINGIENPLKKYIEHVWESISLEDYKTLLQKSPNQSIQNQEIYQEYTKKIKAKNESEKWTKILALEQDKLLHFILAFPQKLAVIKTGSKNQEKAFLGYEFSNRRGSEGIHPIQRSKSIDECTQLYDTSNFENPEKASTYIYKAFNNEFDVELPDSLKQNISYHRLIDMLTFDRVDFEKSISLSTKKKVNFESRWDISTLDKMCEIYQPKTITSQQVKDKGKYKVYGANGVIGYYSEYNHEFSEIAITCRGATCGRLNYTEPKSWITGNAMVIRPKTESLQKGFLKIYLANIELNSVITGTAQPQITRTNLGPFPIPLPPKDIQQKIVAEIEKLEKQEQKAVGEIKELRKGIGRIINNSKGGLVKLEDITTKIGSGATPKGGKGSYQSSGISLIRSQNIYDEGFVEKGLAHINEEQAKKLDNVTVEKNDILFNITGASVARCCIVEDKYLPARVNQHVSIIRTNEKALPKYLQMTLVGSSVKERLLEIGDGGTSRQAITKLQLEEFKIPLPPLKDQEKIVSEIEKIEKKIQTLEKQIAEIPKQKEATLKKYLE